VNFWIFAKDTFVSLGPLAIPLFLAFSIVFIITVERAIFYSFVWRQENAFIAIKDVILNNRLYPKHLREDLIEIELENISRSLSFGLGIMKFIAGLATMLGLLGTVLGMIDVFSSIAGVKTSVSPAMISLGIKKAMFTTAYGLIIGIFALFMHYIFESIARKIFLKMEEYAIILNTTTEYERLSDAAKKK
jgi:biopolymer transport protein ExbB